MTIRFYDTMARRKVEFKPREPGKVSMYVCGPTVYNHIHIGNARTFLSFDVIRRYFEHRGYQVLFVQNITDVDDKIIARAAEEGVEPAEVARKYTAAFLEAMEHLGVRPPTVQPRATETIPEMVRMVERLLEGGCAYEVDGDVYFAVRAFAGYGELSGRAVDDLESGARVEVDDRKRDPLDFALWKAAKPGEPHWPSPWGEGRPGWHLECSVMSEKELGLPFDIHGGATDLVFPHHENERAQSEAVTGGCFATHWLHGGLLQVDAEKMSKSAGNFMLLRDVLATHEPAAVRLLMLQTHYRSPLDYSAARLDDAAATLDRVRNSLKEMAWAAEHATSGAGAPGADREALSAAIASAHVRFTAEMDDDFNTAGAVAGIFELVRAANSYVSAHGGALDARDAEVLAEAAAAVEGLLAVLGVEPRAADPDGSPPEAVELAAALAGYQGDDPDAAVDALLAARAAARTERNWSAADAVRDGLAGLGLIVEDTPAGPRVVRRPGVR